MEGQEDSTCEYCGGTCPASPPSPPKACCCHVCIPASPREAPETNEDSAHAQEVSGKKKLEQSTCTPEKDEKGEVRPGECRCVKLIQLCCGSYSRYMQGVVRFDNWHSSAEPSSPSPMNQKAGGHNCVMDPDAALSPAVMGDDALKKEQQDAGSIGPHVATAAEPNGSSSSEAAVVGDSNVFWVFGYGSLIWKTDGLPAKERVAGYIKGFKRVFFQVRYRGVSISVLCLAFFAAGCPALCS